MDGGIKLCNFHVNGKRGLYLDIKRNVRYDENDYAEICR